FLVAGETLGEALVRVRVWGVGERVMSVDAIDEEKRLVGVVPTRRLLTASLETALREVMVQRVVAVPAKATVLDACEFFVLYKFLAFPVVDEQRRVVGVIDANLFAEEILEAGDTEDQSRSREAVPVGPEFFAALGFRLEQIRGDADWLAAAFRRELATAVLLGVSCGFVVCVIAWVWRDDLRAATVIGGSIALSLVTACALGLAVPSLLHRFNLDPKIAAGPVTLALA